MEYVIFDHMQWAGRAVDADLTMLLDEADRTLYSYGEHVYEIPRIVAIKTTYDAVCDALHDRLLIGESSTPPHHRAVMANCNATSTPHTPHQ